MTLRRLLPIALVLLVQVAPLLWLANTAIRPERGILIADSLRLDEPVTLDNFKGLSTTSFYSWLVTSLTLATFASATATVTGHLFAFGCLISRKPLWRSVRSLALAAYLIPAMFLVFPVQLLYQMSGIRIAAIALVIVHQLFLFPVSVWLASSYLDRIPVGYVSLGIIDNLTPAEYWSLLYWPFAREALKVTFAVTFVLSYQEYIYSFVLTSSSSFITIPVGMASLQAGDVYQWALIGAGGVVTTIVSAVIVATLSRTLEKGIERSVTANG